MIRAGFWLRVSLVLAPVQTRGYLPLSSLGPGVTGS